MTLMAHLNEETKIFPVEEHNVMLSKQLPIGSHQHFKADHHTNRSNSARNIKGKLVTIYTLVIQHLLPDAPFTTAAYKTAVRKIHREDVSNGVDKSYSRLMGTT